MYIRLIIMQTNLTKKSIVTPVARMLMYRDNTQKQAVLPPPLGVYTLGLVRAKRAPAFWNSDDLGRPIHRAATKLAGGLGLGFMVGLGLA